MPKASAYFTLNGTLEKHDVKKLKRELDSVHGVRSVSIGGQSVSVDYDTTGANQQHIQRVIEGMGFSVSDARSENHIM